MCSWQPLALQMKQLQLLLGKLNFVCTPLPVGWIFLQRLSFAAYFAGRWCAWPQRWVDAGFTKNLALLELFPLVVAVEIWGFPLYNKSVQFHSDNMTKLCGHLFRVLWPHLPGQHMLKCGCSGFGQSGWLVTCSGESNRRDLFLWFIGNLLKWG